MSSGASRSGLGTAPLASSEQRTEKLACVSAFTSLSPSQHHPHPHRARLASRNGVCGCAKCCAWGERSVTHLTTVSPGLSCQCYLLWPRAVPGPRAQRPTALYLPVDTVSLPLNTTTAVERSALQTCRPHPLSDTRLAIIPVSSHFRRCLSYRCWATPLATPPGCLPEATLWTHWGRGPVADCPVMRRGESLRSYVM